MRKITTLALILITLIGSSQITMEKKSILTPVANEWQFVKMYTNFVTENVVISEDSVMYSFSEIPSSIKERNFKTGWEQVGDTLFQFTNKTRVDLTYGRKLIVYQYVRKHVYKNYERDRPEKMLFYLKKGKEMGVNNAQFFNYLPIDSIINDIYIPSTDTIL